MGMGIANHIWNGHNVYAALLTVGNGSSAIEYLNGNIYCPWHKAYHKPQAEGYSPLSIQEFSDARINEFRYSAACLGVKPENTRVFGFHDGEISIDAVKGIIMGFVSRHPGAAIKTTSYYDIHPDHSACGQALIELYNDGKVGDARFYKSGSVE
jgi:LmbE family N-acetylglucosaminyl deacetylase